MFYMYMCYIFRVYNVAFHSVLYETVSLSMDTYYISSLM